MVTPNLTETCFQKKFALADEMFQACFKQAGRALEETEEHNTGLQEAAAPGHYAVLSHVTLQT